MYNFWVRLVGLWVTVGLKSGLYAAWSRFYRWLYEGDWRSYSVVPLACIDDAVNVARSYVWRADGPKQLWDAAASPNAVQAYIDGQLRATEGFDCEDLANYLTYALWLAKSLGTSRHPNLSGVYVLSVAWVDDWKPNGHAVCAFQWDDGRWSWMDYGLPSPKMDTLRDVALDVVSRHKKRHAYRHAVALYTLSDTQVRCLSTARP